MLCQKTHFISKLREYLYTQRKFFLQEFDQNLIGDMEVKILLERDLQYLTTKEIHFLITQLEAKINPNQESPNFMPAVLIFGLRVKSYL